MAARARGAGEKKSPRSRLQRVRAEVDRLNYSKRRVGGSLRAIRGADNSNKRRLIITLAYSRAAPVY